MENLNRPVYLNLVRLATKMSITAKVSILHRVSGVLLFSSIPLILYTLHLSLTDTDFYTHFYHIERSLGIKVICLILIWAIMHHICSGIRFLLLDMHIGVDRLNSQRTARVVLIVSLILTICAGALLW